MGGERGEGRAAAAGGGSELTCGSGTSAWKTKLLLECEGLTSQSNTDSSARLS